MRERYCFAFQGARDKDALGGAAGGTQVCGG